jgi:hypothetical protein
MALRPTMQFQQLNRAYQTDPRRVLGQALMQQGVSTAPVQTPLQGLGRLSNALVGAFLQRKASDRLAEQEKAARDAITAALPANVNPAIAGLVQTQPDAISSAITQAALAPKTELITQQIEGAPGAVVVGTKTTSPFGVETVTPNTVYKPPTPKKPDVITFQNPNNAEDQVSLLTTDPEFTAKAQDLLNQNYVRRQGGGTNVSLSPTIQMGQEQESEFRKQSAQAAAKRIEDLSKQVQSESDLITRLNIADNLLEGGTETGPIQNITMPLRNILKGFGALNDEQARQLTNQQVLTAAFNYIIPRMRVVGSGATSDFEARLFTSATANMSNTPEANKVLVKSMQALVERRQKILEAMETYANDNNDLIGFAKYADEKVPPAFKAYMTDQEYDQAVANGELADGDLYFNGITSTFEIFEG